MPAPGGCRRAGAFALSTQTIGPAPAVCQVTRVFPVARSRCEPAVDAGLRGEWQRGGNSAPAAWNDQSVNVRSSDERAAAFLEAPKFSGGQDVVDPLRFDPEAFGGLNDCHVRR